MALTVCGRHQLSVARYVLSTLSVRLRTSLSSSCHRAQHTGLMRHSQLLLQLGWLQCGYVYVDSRSSACRVLAHKGVFCGTEAGAVSTDKGPLSGIRVLDLTRYVNNYTTDTTFYLNVL